MAATHPFRRSGRPRHPDVLTPAEWEVLAGVRDELSNREIAERRGCDLETVRFHLRNIRRKLALESRDELRVFPGRSVEEQQRGRALRREGRVREQIPLIQTVDMERSLAFYVDLLGFEVVARWPDTGDSPLWVAIAAGGARIMLHVGHPKREVDHRHQPGTVTLNFYVDRLDRVHRALRAAGHACGRIERLFYGAREFYTLDPDGNELAIVEFAAGDPGYLPRATTRRKKR
jgi:DNA-binding CsgD family transcriptional regulator/catechol 2,3-dioxygenase-like lactoylglutathione lyase family enzyme